MRNNYYIRDDPPKRGEWLLVEFPALERIDTLRIQEDIPEDIDRFLGRHIRLLVVNIQIDYQVRCKGIDDFGYWDAELRRWNELDRILYDI